MKITVDESLFVDMFNNYGRGDQFSYEGLQTLFAWYDCLGDENMELDIIAICCDWTEYDNLDLIREYGYLIEREYNEDDEHFLDDIVEALNERTELIQLEQGYIVLAF